MCLSILNYPYQTTSSLPIHLVYKYFLAYLVVLLVINYNQLYYIWRSTDFFYNYDKLLNYLFYRLLQNLLFHYTLLILKHPIFLFHIMIEQNYINFLGILLFGDYILFQLYILIHLGIIVK